MYFVGLVIDLFDFNIDYNNLLVSFIREFDCFFRFRVLEEKGFAVERVKWILL